jgi:S-DNA-T family DNA segregation ATPase FtsK/SpoIIIE
MGERYMSSYDDEMLDDDEYHDDDDDYYDEDEDEDDEPSIRKPSSSGNPYSGGLPGRATFGSTRQGDDTSGRVFGSGTGGSSSSGSSTFGSSSGSGTFSSPDRFGTGSRFSGGQSTNPTSRQTTGSGSGVGSNIRPFGSGSSSDSASSRPSSTGTTGSSSSTSRFNESVNKPNNPSFSPPKSDSKPAEDEKKSGIGGFGSKFGIGKKDDADKPDDKKASAKADDGEKKGGFGGLGGFSSKLGIGKKDDADKPDDKKASAKADDGEKKGGFGGLGGFGSKLGIGKKDDANKSDDKKASAKADDGEKKGGFGGLGSFGSKLGIGKKDDAPKSTTPPKSSAPSSSGSSGMSPFASSKTSAGGDTKSAPASKTKAKEADEGLSWGTRIKERLPFLGHRATAERKSKTNKSKTSKVPQRAEGDGLSLDDKLDIAGVALMFSSLVILFSSASGQQGSITGFLNNLLATTLGRGAICVPLALGAVGFWLIVRHFGEDAPEIDFVRVAGALSGYLAFLVCMMILETFTNPYYSSEILQSVNAPQWWDKITSETVAKGHGGGHVGLFLYNILVNNIGEIGTIVAVIGWVVISFMLLTRTTAAELAVIVISAFRSWRANLQQRAQAKRIERAKQQKLLEAKLLAENHQAELTITKPEPEALPTTAQPALLEAENATIEERAIPIRVGGQPLAPALQEVNEPISVIEEETPEDQPDKGLFGGRFARPTFGGPKEPVTTDKPDKVSGLFGGFGKSSPFGAKKTSDEQEKTASLDVAKDVANDVATPEKLDEKPSTPNFAASAVAGVAGSLLNRNRRDDEDEIDEDDESILHESDLPRRSPFDTAPPDSLAKGYQPPITPKPLETSEEVAGPFSKPRASEPWKPRPFGKPAETDAPDKATADRESVSQTPVSMPTATTPITPKPEPTPQPSVTASVQETVKPSEPAINPDRQAPKPDSKPVISQSPIKPKGWKLPDHRGLLVSGSQGEFDRDKLVHRARLIEETLRSFGAPGKVVEINTGPVITQFGIEPQYLESRGGKKNRVKVSAIAQLDKDIQLSLGAKSIRIEAPVPGKGFVGIEVPNEQASLVSLRDVMESPQFNKLADKSPLAIALGQSVDGAPVSADLASMPHLLIAGTTGSGKSVCVNAVIASILIRNSPDMVKFIMVDPKRVELTGYNGIPHLVAPVVVELERIVGVLKWVTREMDRRYSEFSHAGARNIEDFNSHLPAGKDKLPYIVVIIDELADLMMLAPDETERVITRLAALARATGIHLVIATQRPSVDVVTGLIKANFPARIAFAVAGGVDSRVILDHPGAEKLLGKGDMLYMSGDSPAPLRLQGVYVSDMEIRNINQFWKDQARDKGDYKAPSALMSDDEPEPQQKVVIPRGERFGVTPPPSFSQRPAETNKQEQSFWDEISPANPANHSAAFGTTKADKNSHEDELYGEAVELVRRLNKASVSLLQRRLRIGYTRAARLIDVMEAEGIVGPPTEGSKPREVLPSK